MRVVLYNIAAVTKSDNPQASLLTTILMIGGLLVLKGIIGTRVYKNTLAAIMETLSLLNLLALAAFSLYNFKADSLKQTIIAYISTIVTLLMLVSGIIYHIILLIKRKRNLAREYSLAPLIVETPAPPPPNEVTLGYSIVDISDPHFKPSDMQ